MWTTQTIGFVFILCRFASLETVPSTSGQSQPYQFGYTVRDKATGDFKSHHEVNNGKEVRGRYSLVEPTGDLRVVTYTADKTNGFRAVVSREPPAQPTPSYYPIQGGVPLHQPMQKLRRQHDQLPEHHATIAANTRQGQSTQENNQNQSSQRIESQNNTTEGEQVMTVEKGLFSLAENISQIVNYFGNKSEGINEETFSSQNFQEEGPQIIPVKIQQSFSENPTDIQEPVLKVQRTTLTPNKETDEVLHKVTGSPNITDNEDNLNSDTSQVKPSQNDFIKVASDDLKRTNNTNQQDIIKSMMELNHSMANKSDIKSTTQTMLDSLFTTTIYSKVPQNKPTETITNPVITDKQKENVAESNLNNKVMLSALLIPTSPVLKFTCTPDHSENTNERTAPRVTNNGPMPAGHIKPLPLLPTLNKPFLTPSIPLFPFQLVNFNPIKGVNFTPELINKFTLPNIPSVFSTKAPATTVSAIFSGKKSTGLPQPEISNHKQEQASIKPKPPNGYTNLRSEGSPGQKVQSSHYPHHLLPPPWAPHPYHPARNTHYGHMPIFVLPMSHNFNFAPTFDPSLNEHHNQ